MQTQHPLPPRSLLALASALLLSSLVLPSCGDSGKTFAEAVDPVIYTSFYPTQYFAERIAQGKVPVICPLPSDADPIFWQPPRDVLAKFQSASLVILNGAEFEKWAANASLPHSRTIETTKSFESDFITIESMTHSHGAGDHTHEGTDGHTWLDPHNAKVQAGAIHAAMVRRFPEHEKTFDEGLKALSADLDSLDARLEKMKETLSGLKILCSHPAYNYLARRYAWDIENFDFDPEEELSAEALAALGEAANKLDENLRIILWESAPIDSIRDGLKADLGLTCVEFSPCELKDPAADEDYLTVMRSNLDRLESALSPE